MKLHVTIKQEDSSEHTWTPAWLQRYLSGIMKSRGVALRIHGSDGTYIEVFPMCEKCGWYNTVKPIRDGLCTDCAMDRHEEAESRDTLGSESGHHATGW